MVRRCSSSFAAVALCVLATWGLASLVMPAFVVPPSTLEKQQLDMPQPERFAALAAAAAMVPEAAHAANNGYALQQLFSAIFVIGPALVPAAAHAANNGYALQQLFSAIFVIGLGPAVLFWIYFNKPELL
eukprot:CAMPEP_0172782620 /NCGR_PEP_ID=MMETSP1074-20121228/204024_1 /TAXON_ID=2916 /ORGANISM="Ceratium fusus, Strain PA161109" /LENGTH=129 /DNA_ID=CAMNT_0013619603 /DNA_START=84 /DNA_END=473 /DNA_ORIENTATION=-